MGFDLFMILMCSYLVTCSRFQNSVNSTVHIDMKTAKNMVIGLSTM